MSIKTVCFFCSQDRTTVVFFSRGQICVQDTNDPKTLAVNLKVINSYFSGIYLSIYSLYLFLYIMTIKVREITGQYAHFVEKEAVILYF